MNSSALSFNDPLYISNFGSLKSSTNQYSQDFQRKYVNHFYLLLLLMLFEIQWYVFWPIYLLPFFIDCNQLKFSTCLNLILTIRFNGRLEHFINLCLLLKSTLPWYVETRLIRIIGILWSIAFTLNWKSFII